MKKYFAKYLPVVEGEIREGDFFFNGDMLCKCDSSHSSEEWKTDEFINGYSVNTEIYYSFETEKCKKVKLFLCSRDVQVGDEVYCTLTPEKESFILKENMAKEFCSKVIGEISPNAVWVKEGDEFDEEGVDFVIAVTDEDYEKPAKEQKPFYMIKCPTCKTFH